MGLTVNPNCAAKCYAKGGMRLKASNAIAQGNALGLRRCVPLAQGVVFGATPNRKPIPARRDS